MRVLPLLRGLFVSSVIAWPLAADSAHAAIGLLTNGDFETGGFTGWTVANQAGGNGDWFISTPVAPSPVSTAATAPNPAGGMFYAITDQTGAGTHALLQSFTVPADATSVMLSFQMFVNDQDSGPLVNPAGLDYTATPNQHGRVDILSATADAFSTAAADVLSNFYLGVDPKPNPNPYTPYLFDVTGLLTPGATYQLRFAEVDNQLFFQMGVDNVSIVAESGEVSGVPEASSLAIWCLGGCTFALVANIRRRVLARAA